MLRTSKIFLLALLVIGGSVLALPKTAQAGGKVPTQMVSENPQFNVMFFSLEEGKPDYSVNINEMRVVGNHGSSFLQLQSATTGKKWLERFENDAAIVRWLEISKKSNFQGAIPLGFSQ